MPLYGRRQSKPNPGVGIDPAHPLARGLVAFFALNEGGSSRPFDAAAQIQAASNSATWAATPVGAGLSFNGTSGSLGLGSGAKRLNLTGPFSIATYAATAINTGGFWIDGRTSGTFQNGYTFSPSSNAMSLNCIQGATGSAVNSAANAVDGNWHVFAVSLASTGTNGCSFYRDGLPFGTATQTQFPASSTGPWAIGSRCDGAAAFLTGPMGWFGVWSRALSAAEHAALAANPWQVFTPPPPLTIRGASAAVPPHFLGLLGVGS